MEKQIIAVITPKKKSTRYDDNASCSLDKLNILIKPNLKFRRKVIQKLNNNLLSSRD